jgi:hypothetical protein
MACGDGMGCGEFEIIGSGGGWIPTVLDPLQLTIIMRQTKSKRE